MNILIPILSRDFDPTEVAMPWKILRGAGHQVIFSTPDSKPGSADPMMISGEGLDPWGWIPGLKKMRLFGLLLRADRRGRQAYRELQIDPSFTSPRRYDDLRIEDYDGLLLPGGHAQGMKSFLESKVLQKFIVSFFENCDTRGQHKPIAAICHGVVLVSRSTSAKTGKSVLFGRKTTALTWKLESSAWNLCKYLIRFWDPDYYRTYREKKNEPVGYWSVEQEAKRALAKESDFLDVPNDVAHRSKKTSGTSRDRPGDATAAWVVRDGNYVSARWPGDAHTFADCFVKVLAEHYESNVLIAKNAFDTSIRH